MAHINLLPWREELRKDREKRFGAWAGIGLGVAAVIFGLVHFLIAGWIEYQNMRNNYLKEQIALAEKQIEEIKTLEAERQRLYDRMKIIQQLQASRPDPVYLLDELVTTLPEGVYYTNITQDKNKITLKGVAQSSARVATLMRNIDESPWLKVPWLNQIESKEQKTRRVGEFVLQVQQDRPKKEGEEGDGQLGAGGTSP